MAGNPLVMTYLDGGGVHEGEAGAVAPALLQAGQQWDDHHRSQFNEPVAADQTGEFGYGLKAILAVVPIMLLMTTFHQKHVQFFLVFLKGAF